MTGIKLLVDRKCKNISCNSIVFKVPSELLIPTLQCGDAQACQAWVMSLFVLIVQTLCGSCCLLKCKHPVKFLIKDLSFKVEFKAAK